MTALGISLENFSKSLDQVNEGFPREPLIQSATTFSLKCPLCSTDRRHYICLHNIIVLSELIKETKKRTKVSSPMTRHPICENPYVGFVECDGLPLLTSSYSFLPESQGLHLPLPLPIFKLLTSRLFWITKLHDKSWIWRNPIKSYAASVCLSIELANLVHHSTRNANSHFHITLAQTMHEALPFSSAVGGRPSSRFHCYDWLSEWMWMVMGFIRRSDEAAASAFDCPARVLSCVRAHGVEHPVIIISRM